MLKADPAGADARLAAARRERRVWVDPREDGMAELRALLSAPDAMRVYAALGEAGWAARCAERDARREQDARAAQRGEPPLDAGPLPKLDQCRADALVDLLCGTGVPTRTGPSPRGQHPQILVTIPAGTLLGLGGEPAHLAGYGPIPDSMARELARDGTWRRVLTDPATGAVLDVGRRQHDPPADLDRFIRIRDGMCRFPGGEAFTQPAPAHPPDEAGDPDGEWLADLALADALARADDPDAAPDWAHRPARDDAA